MFFYGIKKLHWRGRLKILLKINEDKLSVLVVIPFNSFLIIVNRLNKIHRIDYKKLMLYSFVLGFPNFVRWK
jgi:hypothetical protein